MANLTRLDVYCRRNHPPRKMYFAGYDALGNARYKCPLCSITRRYQYIYGQIKRVA